MDDMKTRYLKTEIALNPDYDSDFDDDGDDTDRTVFKPCVIDLLAVSFFYDSLEGTGTTVHLAKEMALRVSMPFEEFSEAFCKATA